MAVLNLKSIRKSKKVSQLQLSKRSGISRSYICELEHDVYTNPGLDVVCKLCKILDVTPNELICEKNYTRGDLNDRKRN